MEYKNKVEPGNSIHNGTLITNSINKRCYGLNFVHCFVFRNLFDFNLAFENMT